MPKRTLRAAQLSALRWVAVYGTIPPCPPATWQSLVSRGLITLTPGEPPSLTADGHGYLS